MSESRSEAVKWFRKAALQGNPTAQHSLGSCYEAGEGVLKDYAEAAKWYRKAAEQGEQLAQINLGTCYANGRGVLPDYIAAYKWFNLAASQAAGAFERLILKDSKVPEYIKLSGKGDRYSLSNYSRYNYWQEVQTCTGPPTEAESSSASIMQTHPEASGTGFFISEDGFLVTNEHVVRDAEEVRLVTGAGLITAKVVKLDAVNDLALLKATGRFLRFRLRRVAR